MLIPTAVMGAVAVVLFLVAYRKGQGQHIAGIKAAIGMIWPILPLLFFAFVVAGIAQELLPRELLGRWVGPESGVRGILAGTVAGGLCPGGPYVSMPIAAGFLRMGAGLGTMVAFLTAWSLWAVARLPTEVAFMGWKFTLVRLATTFFFPPLAGWLAAAFFQGVR
jgi:uncharacterized membrane protein YraQ (UPF0718 family)